MLKLKTYLSTHVRNGKIILWDDGLIIPGTRWNEEIKEKLRQSHIILLLISADFNDSDYIQNTELPIAFDREKLNECAIVPIFVRNCFYKDEEYANLGMIPLMDDVDKSLQPLNSPKWGTEADAFTKVVDQLDGLFNSFLIQQKAQQNSPKSFVYSIDSVWSDIPLKETFGLRITVDCNRENEYTQTLCADFDGKARTDQNLCYFICGCESQNPESIAKRLVYEFEEDFINCWPGTNITIDTLEIRHKKEATWRNFWHIFQKCFTDEFSDFDHFALQSTTFLEPYTRIPIFCIVKENDWSGVREVETHLRYIIKQFTSLPVGCHKFVLFFILEFEDLHKLLLADGPQCPRNWERLQDFNIEDDNCIKPHIQQILLKNTVSEQEV